MREWISKGIYGGATTNYGLVYHNSVDASWNELDENSTLTIVEDISRDYLEQYFYDYFDEEINPKDDHFDHYGWNFYTIETVEKIIAELEWKNPDEQVDDFYNEFCTYMKTFIAENPDRPYLLVMGP